MGGQRNGCWPCARNQSLHTPARERGEGKKSDTNAPYEKNRLDQQLVEEEGREGWREGGKANLFTRSLKYKLQEARTFWWTSNSLPSTIIFRSVNSFSLRCWFNSFNISVEQEKKTDNATSWVQYFLIRFFFSFLFFAKDTNMNNIIVHGQRDNTNKRAACRKNNSGQF